MNYKFDVTIIGGGLGGLTAGATLAKLGKRVLLLEQHYVPGGCATTFKRKDFVMEVGLHEMDGFFENDFKSKIFDFLGVTDNVDFVEIPELYRFKCNDIDFVQPHGITEAIKSLVCDYPAEETGIRLLFKIMSGVISESAKYPPQKWKQLLIMPIMPLLFPNLVKTSKISIGHWLDKNIKNENLKLTLLASLLYYHDDPYSTSLTYFSLAQGSYLAGGGLFIKGGSQILSNYLRTVIENNNGQVLLGKKVDRILIEDERAVGVAFKDNYNKTLPEIKVYSTAVIANAAIPLVKNLLPEIESKKLAVKIDNLKPACGLLSVYLGFNREPKELGVKHYSTFICGDNIANIGDILPSNQGDWHNKGLVFVDYSQVDSKLAPKGKSVGVIGAIDYLSDWDKLEDDAYKNQKDAVAKILIARLEKVFPGISAHIEYYEVGTSRTVRSYTLNPAGAPYGYAQTPQQAGGGRLPHASPVKQLYFAGAWTFPGGGFTGAILSGYLCATNVNQSIVNNSNEQSLLPDNRAVKLISTEQIALNTVELTVEKPADFSYVAGQYAVLVNVDPKYTELDMPFRSLSIVSHPDEDVLRFAMRLSESSYKKSIKSMVPGDKYMVYGPLGNFSVSTEARGIVFLVSGIGITPILPLLKELHKQNYAKPVYLFYSNKTASTTAYHQLLETIPLPSFKYISICTQDQTRINENMLKEALIKFDIFDYYIVGGGNFISAMKHTLLANGVPKEQIKIDDFG
ncbi:MAG: FAD-dependent oxidoreductase [Pseudomonadota bacterium]